MRFNYNTRLPILYSSYSLIREKIADFEEKCLMLKTSVEFINFSPVQIAFCKIKWLILLQIIYEIFWINSVLLWKSVNKVVLIKFSFFTLHLSINNYESMAVMSSHCLSLPENKFDNRTCLQLCENGTENNKLFGSSATRSLLS